MGASPHTPSLYYDKGMARKEGMGGREWENICPLTGRLAARGKHGIREHLPSDKLTASGACRNHNFRIPIIRVSR